MAPNSKRRDGAHLLRMRLVFSRCPPPPHSLHRRLSRWCEQRPAPRILAPRGTSHDGAAELCFGFWEETTPAKGPRDRGTR